MINKAILLAAGRGTRLGHLTDDRPKPMVPVCGLPVLEHIMLRLIKEGITQFILVIGYRGDVIRSYFQDGSHRGISVVYAEQPVPNGTGSALAAARTAAGDAPFLASFGDILSDAAHYHDLIARFNSCGCAATIGINPGDPTAGAAVWREGDRLTRVVEKPRPGTAPENWNVAGISVYGPEIWPAIAALKPSHRGEYEITDAIQGMITAGNDVRTVELHGFWSDVGTPEALAEAEKYVEVMHQAE